MSTAYRQGKLAIVTLGRVSFETGELGSHRVTFPYRAQVLKVRARTTKALSATDAGTLTAGNASGASANGVITIPLSTAFGTDFVATPTTNNVVPAGSYYEVVSAKTTVGGTVNVTLEVLVD